MLPTFVIALREGVEASLIIGIIATFLSQRGRSDAFRWMWTGVSLAATLCLAIGIALQIVGRELPQKQQEGLETVIGLLAVGVVTYMIVWMKRHSRELKKLLEHHAGSAVASGSVVALVAMAFFAVLREGLETAVFFLAAFQSTKSPALAATGAILGLVTAIALGYAIYKGGVRINLSKFFRFTGALLVLVAAGLVSSALHTAHEAGWINAAQTQVFDMTWLVEPGSVRSALLTGMLGLQPRPVVLEVAGWLLYVIPVFAYVLWKPKPKLQPVPVTTSTKSQATSVRQ